MTQLYETRDEQSYEDLQYQLEEDHDTAAAIRIVKEREERLAKGDVLNDPKVHNIIRSAYADVYSNLEDHVTTRTSGTGAKYKKVLRAVPLDTLTGVVLVTLIRYCLASSRMDRRPVFQELARALGQSIAVEARIAQAEAVNPLYMKRVHEDLEKRAAKSTRHRSAVYAAAYRNVMKGEMQFELSVTDYIHIGKFGLDAAFKAGVLEQHRSYDSTGTAVVYELAPAIFQYIVSNDDASIVRSVLATTFRQMICPPDPWDAPVGGGYKSPRRKAMAHLVSTHRMPPKAKRDYYASLKIETMPKVYEVANYLQNVTFTYHSPSIEVIRKIWETGGGIMGIPPREQAAKPDFPFPQEWREETATPEEQQIFRMWKRTAANWYTEQSKLRGKQIEIWGFIRNFSTIYDKHWYPVFFDKRSRFYYQGYPNPQGSDVSKAVIHFHNRKQLGREGVFWLKVHIANCLGIDDIRFKQRVKYVDDNWHLLSRAVQDPITYYEAFGDEAPMCAYAACYELNQAYNTGDPEGYYTGIPVHMDATVSGTQHFSALLRDPVGAKYTNLVDIGGETKADLYKRVAESTIDSLKGDIASGKNVEEATMWVQLGIPRDLAKKPVMTFTYGVTLYSTQEYIYDWLDTTYPELGRDLPRTHITYLAKKLFAGIEATIPATVRGMAYLQSVGREMGKLGEITWNNLETNFPVQHIYYKMKDKRVRVNSAGLTLVTVREPTDEVQPRSMTSALAPNFIHNLDATHVNMVGLKMKHGGLDMIGIHDSIGTHPSDVPTMNAHIRQEFVTLYEHNHLENFKKCVGSELELPEFGDFDLNEVLDSEFFFC